MNCCETGPWGQPGTECNGGGGDGCDARQRWRLYICRLEKPRTPRRTLAHGALARVPGLGLHRQCHIRTHIHTIEIIRTASTEELREHVEGVGVRMLAALVGLQALLAMTVVYLSFLSPLGQDHQLRRWV